MKLEKLLGGLEVKSKLTSKKIINCISETFLASLNGLVFRELREY